MRAEGWGKLPEGSNKQWIEFYQDLASRYLEDHSEDKEEEVVGALKALRHSQKTSEKGKRALEEVEEEGEAGLEQPKSKRTTRERERERSPSPPSASTRENDVTFQS